MVRNRSRRLVTGAAIAAALALGAWLLWPPPPTVPDVIDMTAPTGLEPGTSPTASVDKTGNA
ncbi:MAG: hypothetical protein ABIP94_21225, partial [Planctomycetota bacterium]